MKIPPGFVKTVSGLIVPIRCASIPVHFNGSLLNIMGGSASSPPPPSQPITRVVISFPSVA